MKILIADDEDYTREGLIEAVEFQKYGIDEIMQAVNGAEAYKIAKWFRPDIVLSDIRMPKMDGVEFATKLKALIPDSIIIFMSGYMDIDYLKSAIRLDAIDYLEKPISLKSVEDALLKATDRIRERGRVKAAMEPYSFFWTQRFLNALSSKADEYTLKKLAQEVGFPLYHNGEFLCFILMFSKKSVESGAKKELLDKTLREISGTLVGNFNLEKQWYEYILAYADKEKYRVIPFLRRITDDFPDARLGIGMEAKNYRNIYNSYNMACAAINCAFYQEDERFFQIDDMILQKHFIEPGVYGEFLRVLSESPGELRDWFEELFAQLKKNKYYHKDQIYTLAVSLLTAIYMKYPQAYAIHPQIQKEEQIQPCVRNLESLAEIQDLVLLVLSQLGEERKQIEKYSYAVRGAMDYIAEHFAEVDLNMERIGDSVNLSATYLNVLFRQETGYTIKQYISNYRLEHAKKLLREDYERIGEIAHSCGYANANYFARIFREATGMSPAEFRKGDSL